MRSASGGGGEKGASTGVSRDGLMPYENRGLTLAGKRVVLEIQYASPSMASGLRQGRDV